MTQKIKGMDGESSSHVKDTVMETNPNYRAKLLVAAGLKYLF